MTARAPTSGLRPAWLRITLLTVISATHAAAIGGVRMPADSLAPPSYATFGVVARGEIAFDAMATPVPDRSVTQQAQQEASEPEQEAARSPEPAQPEPQSMAALPSESEPDVEKPNDRPDVAEEKRDQPEAASPTLAQAQDGPAARASAESLGVDEDKPETSTPSRLTAAQYAALVSAEINRRKHYPAEARRRGERGAVAVSFVVGRSGQIVSHAITRSSGSAALDASAASMVAAARLPPPPDGLFRGSIQVTFRVRP